MKKIVGKVSDEEKESMRSLFERKNGLRELVKSISLDDTALYERIIHDMGETEAKFQQWWDDMYEKYQWEKEEDGSWEINFATNEILLVTE